MKLMKHITIALLLCAIPAVAFGQEVSCDDCTHVASVYMGEGGVIATADDADMVTWVATCAGVTRSGELMANDDGVVAALWTGDLACMDEKGGSFEIGPVMDGGWFWVTDDMNSAVGGLVSKDVLENDMADITSAGEGVSMTAGKGAVYLKEASSGRVGILPNILPEPPMDALRTCGANDNGRAGTAAAVAVANAEGARFTRRMHECALGDGGTIVLATTTNTFTGATTMVADKSTLVRPAGTGTTVVTIDLWGNHSGFFTSAADQHALLGNPAIAMSALRGIGRLTAGVTWGGRMGVGPDAADFTSGTAAAGITMDNTTTTGVVTFTIAADSAHCSTRNNYPVTVAASATLTDDGAAVLTPPIGLDKDAPTDTSGGAGSTSFTVVCPSGSGAAQMGQELVPENPFPTRE